MKIVHDAVRDYWRRRRSCEDLDALDERFVAHRPSLESDLDRGRRIALIRRSLERLPASKRAVLELFYVDDRSIPEIARIQGRSVSAVKMDLTRSRRLLAKTVRILESE
jgi:RNA polymerase sigma factor (sigma-70 family)